MVLPSPPIRLLLLRTIGPSIVCPLSVASTLKVRRRWVKQSSEPGDEPQGALTGPARGEFIAPPEVEELDERADALPQQEEFWRPPVRFGSVPVEKQPLGWDRRKGFRKLFPAVYLPFQVVERVAFGHPELEPNRLFWGDNLHVMRQLSSESIDLIYIDPPFFSGRQYNVIFGDQNELRSFSDIWEGGMPGYLIWLNARLYEMKRLLKKTGSIYVHLDWHSNHYVKAEMDKIFGFQNFINEVVWCYDLGGKSKNKFPVKHDNILFYCNGLNDYYFDPDSIRIERVFPNNKIIVENGKKYVVFKKFNREYKYDYDAGAMVEDWWVD